MVKLDGASLLYIGLLCSASVQDSMCSRRSRGVGVTRGRSMNRDRVVLTLRAYTMLMGRAMVIELDTRSGTLVEHGRPVLHWRAELRFGALNAVLDGLLPTPRPLA